MDNCTINGTLECECDDLILQTKFDIFLCVLCVVLAVIGILFTFFGYRCFQAVMFLTGFLFGGIVVFFLCINEELFEQKIPFEMAIGLAGGVGVVCGIITLLVRYVGIFLQGFIMGAFIAFTGIFVMQAFYIPTTPWIPVGIIFFTGSAFSILTLAFQKKCLMISTSVFGSILIIACVDYFLENFYLIKYAWHSLVAMAPSIMCWFSWLLLGSWFILAVFGIILQWKITGKSFDHTNVVIGRRKPARASLDRHSISAAVQDIDEEELQTRQLSQNRCLNEIEPEPPAFDEDIDLDQDLPPPSYYECVDLGAGDPFTDSCFSVDVQSVQPMQDQNENLHQVQSELVLQMQTGTGYSVNHQYRRSVSEQSLHLAPMRNLGFKNIDSRHVSRPLSMAHTRNERLKKTKGQFSRQHRNNSNHSDRHSSSSSFSNVNDVQSLLVQSSRARSSQDAVTAHSERLRAAENRRLSRQSSNR